MTVVKISTFEVPREPASKTLRPRHASASDLGGRRSDREGAPCEPSPGLSELPARSTRQSKVDETERNLDEHRHVV